MRDVLKRALATACLSVLAAGGCAGTGNVVSFDAQGRVWPEPPEIARVAFVGEFSNSTDLGIRGSVWRDLVSFAAGPENDAMVRPMAVATTIDGDVIFVADPDAGCVHRYDLNAGRYRCLRPADDQGRAAPIGLAVTDDGHLFVSDSLRGQMWQAGPRDKRLSPFVVSVSLDQPTGIHWSASAQRLFVAETGRQQILEFDRTGDLKKRFGGRGDLPGQFNFPIDVWVDANNELLVTDALNFRIQRFGGGAVFLHSFGEDGDRPGDFSRPKGVSTDNAGHVYVVDALMHVVQIFNPQGELLLAIGEQGQGPGQFWLPNGIFITGDNLIFVADSYNKRVQVFRYVGPRT